MDFCAIFPRLYCYRLLPTTSRCLKITEKVSFNIASGASYVYILSGQKLIKNAKNGPFWRVFQNLKLAVKQCYQTGQFLIGQKLVENAKIQYALFYCQIHYYARLF